MNIRRAELKDVDAVWGIYQEVIATGIAFMDTPESATKESFVEYWFGTQAGRVCYVAEHHEEAEILGAYILKPNQPGRGKHVANGTYMVAERAMGQGVGIAMGRHSIETAREMGYHAMQFNAVISSNHGAVKLWRKLGFIIVGVIPDAFQHPTLGLVDMFIMYQAL